MIRKILVDFDGTLHDTESVFASKLEGLFGPGGRELYQVYLFDIHRNIVHKRYPDRHDDLDFHWRLLLQHLGEPHDKEKLDLLNARFEEASKAVLEISKLFPDAIPFLDHLTDAGYELYLSSGRDSQVKAEGLRKVGGRDYFTLVFGEEVLGRYKHKPDYYRKALKAIGSSAEEAMSVGDTILTDIYPAKAVGIRTIWVNRTNEEPPTDPKMTPDHEVTNLITVLDYMQDM